MAYVAAGRYDGYWENAVKPWDIAAGCLIVREAGGFISTVNGKSDDPVHSGNVLAANAGLHAELKKLLNSAVPETNAA
jgi:myo-inositol-1(or 4)-monophosphatase